MSQGQNSLFRQQQQLYRSVHYLARPRQPTHYTPYDSSSLQGRKRRVSEDEDMSMDTPTVSLSERIKRNKNEAVYDISVNKLLATLDKDALVELIADLVDCHPHLQTDVDALLPEPTLASVTAVIAEQEHTFHALIKKSRDVTELHQAKTVLTGLVSVVLEYAEYFCQRSDEFPATMIAYLHYATCVIHRLPENSQESCDVNTKDIYADLLSYWKMAVGKAGSQVQNGKIYGQQLVTEWAKQLSFHNAHTHGQFTPVLQQFTKCLGWIVGE
ncbi:hypothetical protein BDF14DRAFT_629806 [Spinellus fusiger]|nr:hypothetical protein BDF14DRAFT_629806 [Spinellus fusiger]